MSQTYTREELEALDYEALRKLSIELEREGAQIKKVRHYFIEQFWQRLKGLPIKVQELNEGKIVPVQMGDRHISFAKVEGKVYAFDNRCPHKGFPLHMGKLDGHTLTCGYHGGQFDLRDGSCVRHPTPTYPCMKFDVTVLEDGTVECK